MLLPSCLKAGAHPFSGGMIDHSRRVGDENAETQRAQSCTEKVRVAGYYSYPLGACQLLGGFERRTAKVALMPFQLAGYRHLRAWSVAAVGRCGSRWRLFLSAFVLCLNADTHPIVASGLPRAVACAIIMGIV